MKDRFNSTIPINIYDYLVLLDEERRLVRSFPCHILIQDIHRLESIQKRICQSLDGTRIIQRDEGTRHGEVIGGHIILTIFFDF